MKINGFVFAFVLACGACWATQAVAEQKHLIGDYEVHYIVIPTTFLKPAIADKYDLVRGKDRALVNVSILDSAGEAVIGTVAGSSRNLLEQRQSLDFSLVEEGDAKYYLALLRHADEEHHRVELTVTVPSGMTDTIRFQQKMYWER